VSAWLGEIKVPVAAIRRAANQGLEEAAEMVKDLSDTRIPYDEGGLLRSGKVSTDPLKMEAAVSYDTEYAVRQHEFMDQVHPGGRQAKYLEDSFNQLRPVLASHIAAVIRRKIR
jgi:hypothetical protein